MAKRLLELDEKDIRSIIAQHFKLDEKCVEVKPYTTTAGYGMNEYEVSTVKAIVSSNCNLEL